MTKNRNDSPSKGDKDMFGNEIKGRYASDANIRNRFRSSYKPEINDSRVRYIDGFVRSKPSERNDVFKQAGDNKETLDQSNQSIKTNRYFGSIENSRAQNTLMPAPKKLPDNKKKIFGRKKKDKKKSGKLKKVRRSLALLFIVAVVGVASVLGYGYFKTRNIFKGDGTGAVALQKDIDPSELNGEGDGRINILVLGKGGPGHEAPDLTDTILLASIDPISNEAALISVPRDLYVKNEDGYSSKINAVYSGAKQSALSDANSSDADRQAAEESGLDAIESVVSEVLGVPIHYYLMVDFTAFKDSIDTLGGITIDAKEPLRDSTMAWLNGGNPVLAEKGSQTFDGNRALIYARSRHGSARGDFDRTERQREVLLALQQKILSSGTFSNPFKVVELINTFGDHIRTDLNGLGEIKRLYEISQMIGGDKVISVGLADPPNVLVSTDTIGSQSVVVPKEGLYQYDDIRSYIRNTVSDPFLKRENARIIILNGTSRAGLATATSDELKSYGYNVVKIDNAPTSNYLKSQLIDLSNGTKEYTKSYMQKRLSLTASSNAPEGIPGSEEADFVIILGQDEITKNTN